MPAGRPKSIDKDVLRKLEDAFMLGCTDEEACLAADIGTSTLYDYQKAHPEFSERKRELKKNPVYKARQAMLSLIDSEDENIRMKAATDALNRYDGKPKDRVELDAVVATETYEEKLARLKGGE